MIVEWLKPVLEWTGLSVGTLLLLILIIIKIIKD